MGLLVVAVLLPSVLITEVVVIVYAQTTPPPTAPPSLSTTTTSEIPLSAPAQQIISDAQTACSQEVGTLAPSLCVSVIHESPNTVVLNGQLLILEGVTGYVANPFIWRAVDGFRGQGYTLTSAELSGQGSQGNPHSWYIAMSKQ
jgi:hypothetical protein